MSRSSRIENQHSTPLGVGGDTVVRPKEFELNDEELVSCIVRGDRGTRRLLFRRYAGHVRLTLVRVLGRDDELADAVQEVFLNVFRDIHKLKDPSALQAWLTRISVYVARAIIRSRTRRKWLRLSRDSDLPPMPTTTPGDEVEAAAAATYRVLESMRSDDRTAFSLRFIGGMSLQETADACGVSLPTIKRRLRRAEGRFMTRAEAMPSLAEWIATSDRWGNR